MAHITCKRHGHRVVVTGQQIIHRGTGALCKGTRLLYRKVELTAQEVITGATKAQNSNSK